MADHDAVLARLRAYYEDVNAGRTSRYASHFWPGATRTMAWIPHSSTYPVVTYRFDSDSLLDGLLGADRHTRWVLREQLLEADIRLQGKVAQVVAHHELRVGKPDSLETTRGLGFFATLAHEGEWRIVGVVYFSEGLLGSPHFPE